MEENTKMEDQLSEELLDMVTGGNGPVADCPSCRIRLHIYNTVKARHENHEIRVDIAAIQGNVHAQHNDKGQADAFYKIAQEQYEKIVGHGHSDFPPVGQ